MPPNIAQGAEVEHGVALHLMLAGETVVVVGTNVGFTLLSTAERDALDREAPQRRL